IGARSQRWQPGRQLARPALHAAEFGAGGGARVDGDRTGQRRGLSQSPAFRVTTPRRACALIGLMATTCPTA
ncbi:MAG: hypothetical protein ACRDK0_15070, partial [Solirubrobacteraceae bacterium]